MAVKPFITLAANRHKQEYPPLLKQGFHRLTVEELRNLCVTGIADSTVRAEIMTGFEIIYEQAAALKIVGEFWIDGSFLTRKIDPDDIDFVLFVSEDMFDNGTVEQKALFEWLIASEDDPKRLFRCHNDLIIIVDP